MPAGLQTELTSRLTRGCQKSLRVPSDIEKVALFCSTFIDLLHLGYWTFLFDDSASKPEATGARSVQRLGCGLQNSGFNSLQGQDVSYLS